MTNRWMAVVLGAAVLAVPGTALAKGGPTARARTRPRATRRPTSTKPEKEKAPKAARFRSSAGVYKGDGVVTAASGGGVRKGGYVGQDVDV